MKKFSYFAASFILLGCLGLMGCDSNNPSAKDSLIACANALEQNDAQAFINSFDLKACAANQIKNMTKANDALNTLDKWGKDLGIGGMQDLIDNVFDMENSLRQNFVKKSSTGELALECQRQTTPGCPWEPKSLRQAQVKLSGPDVAVARVKTPANLTTWLGLARKQKKWVIVGWGSLEDEARAYAEEYTKVKEGTPSPKKDPKAPKKQDEQKHVI